MSRRDCHPIVMYRAVRLLVVPQRLRRALSMIITGLGVGNSTIEITVTVGGRQGTNDDVAADASLPSSDTG
jgi:hypothetical protein